MIGKHFAEKHLRYKQRYGKNELYWGFGIENETYLEYSNPIIVSEHCFLTHHKNERYSVSYYTSYKKDILPEVFSLYFDKEYGKKREKKECELPLLINSYALQHTDVNEQHKTLYLKIPKPNPKFSGKTIDEYLKEESAYYREEFGKSFMYDGDTFEFVTQDFYKTTIHKSIHELIHAKEMFMKNVRPIFPMQREYGKIQFMTKNHPFAIYTTNKNNVSMFNNGTYHFNFTLPTFLNEKGAILNEKQFISDHCKAIRVIQLFTPIFLCMFGSPDPFSKVKDTFSSCSQRCSVSRYIGVGTYDTEKMERGKILTVPIQSLEVSKLPYWWFKRYHMCSSYETLEEIGVDINFNKHYFHGIEIRFFDYFPEEHLESILTFITHLFDVTYSKAELPNYVLSEEWNNMTEKCITYGKQTELSSSELFLFETLLCKPILSSKVFNVYNEIYSELLERFKNGGPVSSVFLRGEEMRAKKVEENEEEEERDDVTEDKEYMENKGCCVIL